MDAKLSNMNVNMGFILDDVWTLQLKMEKKNPGATHQHLIWHQQYT